MKCVNCGGKRGRKSEVAHSVTVSGVKLRGKIATNVCSACGESLIDLEALQRFELEAAAALATHGICTGDAFKFIRKALGMRASDVGGVLGVTPETVSRWETGQRDVDRHVFALLGELAIAAVEGRPSPAERFKALANTERKLPGAINLKRAS
jgi:putative zinc finger/helix-turn-helix YgiT family protein